MRIYNQSPHITGYKCIHKGFDLSTTTATTLWTPASNMTICITDIQLSTSDENTVIIYEGTDDTDTDFWVCKCELKKNTTNNLSTMSLRTPYVSYTPDNPIKIKLSQNKQVFGVLYGYEMDNSN